MIFSAIYPAVSCSPGLPAVLLNEIFAGFHHVSPYKRKGRASSSPLIPACFSCLLIYPMYAFVIVVVIETEGGVYGLEEGMTSLSLGACIGE